MLFWTHVVESLWPDLHFHCYCLNFKSPWKYIYTFKSFGGKWKQVVEYTLYKSLNVDTFINKEEENVISQCQHHWRRVWSCSWVCFRSGEGQLVDLADENQPSSLQGGAWGWHVEPPQGTKQTFIFTWPHLVRLAIFFEMRKDSLRMRLLKYTWELQWQACNVHVYYINCSQCLSQRPFGSITIRHYHEPNTYRWKILCLQLFCAWYKPLFYSAEHLFSGS